MLIIDFLNHNSSAILAIFTIILVLITGYYAGQTRKLTSIMQNEFQLLNRPYLSFKELFRTQDGDQILLKARYKNVGRIPAKVLKKVIIINKKETVREDKHDFMPDEDFPITIENITKMTAVDDFNILMEIYYQANNKAYFTKHTINWKLSTNSAQNISSEMT